MVELETSDVSFTTVDARVLSEVGRQLGLELGPEGRVTTRTHDNVAVTMCLVPCARAGTTPRLETVERRSTKVELRPGKLPLAGTTPLEFEHVRSQPNALDRTRFCGGPRGGRTHNPRIKSPLLCQLS